MKDPKEKLKNISNQKQNGSGMKKDLRSMSMDELVKMAKEKNISGKWDMMNKENLIKALEMAR